MNKLFWIFPVIFVAAVTAAPKTSPQVDGSLQARLQNGEKINIFLKMGEDTSQVLQNVRHAMYSNREQRLNSLHEMLVSHAERTQKAVLSHLTNLSSVEFKSFWVTNQIYVRNADENIVSSLARFPEISRIYEEITAHINAPFNVRNATGKEDLWGMRRIQVQEAWKEMGLGEENLPIIGRIRVGTIDTGVKYRHEALEDNFFGEYGWFDPSIKEPYPNDAMGHGSHTLGTIVGKGIGVAPWAQWMSCRGCPTLSCLMSDLYACGEFLTCPTLFDGTSPDCSKAPHLISNSWSAGQGSPAYNDVIEAWHAAGIIPIFSIGNFRAEMCGSAMSPGDQNVIGVGSTTIEDKVSWFSSVGPTKDGRLKPDVVAPGSDILSASHKSDNSYALMSGTSFACPHVSGIVALLLTRNLGITYEEVRSFLVDTAEHDLIPTGLICQDIPDSIFPNHVFGNGRVNALKVIQAQSQRMIKRG